MANLFDETLPDALAEPEQNTVLRHSYGPGVFDATTAPGTGDDALDGFRPNSLWYDATGKKLYLCIDNTAGAAVWKEVVISDSSPVTPLQQFLTDANGTTSSEVDAYSYTVPANTLTVNGESLHAVYGGTKANTSPDVVTVNFAGTKIGDSEDITTAGDWRFEVDIVRTSNTAARATVLFTHNSVTKVKTTTVSTNLDFTTGEILKLTLYAEDVGTNITAKTGKVWKLRAA